MNNSKKTWFITGASSGIGKALAQAVIARGDNVVVAARRLERLEALALGHEAQVLPLPMDITDAAARELAVAAALARFGGIDVLANIAGRGAAGACEEFSAGQLRAQLELNFFSVAEMTRAVLPHMRQQGSGHVLTLTSIAGLVTTGAAGPYCAAKFAVEGWTEALAIEVAPLGIRVTLVEPGAFRTDFAGDANMRPAERIDAYRPMVAPFEAYLAATAGQQMGDPAKAVECMLAAVDSPKPPSRLILGRDAYSIWDHTIAARIAGIDAWRARGEATAFDGAGTLAIGTFKE